jgi:hypothetical protein
MIRNIFVIAAVLALTACTAEDNTEAPLVTETTAPAKAVRPTLAGGEYDPLIALRGLDPQWTERPYDASTDYTPSLGLERSTTLWRNTSLVYDRTDEGGVYMIQTRSGLPGRCNLGPDLAVAFDQFAQDFALGAGAKELRPKLIEAWASDESSTEAEIGKVMVRAIGGCPRVLVIKAL